MYGQERSLTFCSRRNSFQSKPCITSCFNNPALYESRFPGPRAWLKTLTNPERVGNLSFPIVRTRLVHSITAKYQSPKFFGDRSQIRKIIPFVTRYHPEGGGILAPEFQCSHSTAQSRISSGTDPCQRRHCDVI